MFLKERTALIGLLLFLSVNIVPTAIYAAVNVNDTGIVETAQSGSLRTDKNLPGFIGVLIHGALGIIGALFLLLIVYGGFLWMISEGDTTKVGAARGYIFHSILGLIITLSAYALTDVVISIFTGTNGPLAQ